MPSSSRLLPVVSFVVALAALAVALLRPLLAQKGHELTLTDPSGRARIVLTARDNGGRIELLDSKGKPRAVLHEQDERIALEFAPTGDSATIRLLVNDKGSPSLELRDASNSSDVSLFAGMQTGMLVTTPKATLSISASEIATGLSMYSGTQRAVLDMTQDRAGLVFMHANSMVKLSQSPIYAGLQLAPPGKTDPSVRLAADPHSTSLSLDRSPRTTGLAPIHLSVADDAGVRIQVNGKTLD